MYFGWLPYIHGPAGQARLGAGHEAGRPFVYARWYCVEGRGPLQPSSSLHNIWTLSCFLSEFRGDIILQDQGLLFLFFSYIDFRISIRTVIQVPGYYTRLSSSYLVLTGTLERVLRYCVRVMRWGGQGSGRDDPLRFP